MIKLLTANGEEFDVAWMGVASMDGGLRFGVINSTAEKIFSIFTVPENCTVLTRVFDGVEKEYEGYTVFRGMTINYNDEIVVSMSKN